MYVRKGLLNASVILWICGVVRFNKNTWYVWSVLCKVWCSQISRLTCPATATPGVLKVIYLRNYCSYCLHICIDERMTTSLCANKIKFKNIQKMQEKLKVSTNFLTVPRIISLATVVRVNWNTFALWRDMSEILLIKKVCKNERLIR